MTKTFSDRHQENAPPKRMEKNFFSEVELYIKTSQNPAVNPLKPLTRTQGGNTKS